MFPSWLQILLVVMLALIFFGRGKISDFMTDLASGIKSFRKGMSDAVSYTHLTLPTSNSV